MTGLIVSVGVTVDSYVVYFERLKDEIRTGRTVRQSVDRGFTRSFRTIVAADLVSLIGAVVLYVLAVGSVRGFAFFLGVSVILDLLVAYFFMHPLVGADGAPAASGAHARRRHRRRPRRPGSDGMTSTVAPERTGFRGTLRAIYHERTNFDFVGRSRLWALISGTLMAISIAALLISGLNLGIDFEGGTQWELTVASGEASTDDVRTALDGTRAADARILILGNDGVRVQEAELTTQRPRRRHARHWPSTPECSRRTCRSSTSGRRGATASATRPSPRSSSSSCSSPCTSPSASSGRWRWPRSAPCSTTS